SEGYENPGFAFAITKEKTSASFLSIAGLADSYSDTASSSSETLRRNHRMRSEVAAAIAFMRIHKGEPLDETDILIEKEIEAEVIFSERTMLSSVAEAIIILKPRHSEAIIILKLRHSEAIIILKLRHSEAIIILKLRHSEAIIILKLRHSEAIIILKLRHSEAIIILKLRYVHSFTTLC
ncbi:RNA polymerase II holoenzyme cyclin subunit, partial [Biomphalaria glabrata]